MSKIRAQNTKPEILIRRGLFARGYRYRLHVKSLPGKPDLVFPGKRAVIQINGCFWHGHIDCLRYKPPGENKPYWTRKISGNRSRDLQNEQKLLAADWRILTIWECAIIGKQRLSFEAVMDTCESFLNGTEAIHVVRSQKNVNVEVIDT